MKNRPRYGLYGEHMAAEGNSKINRLTALPGVGAATAKKLVAAKIDTVSKVAGAGSKKLQSAGLSAAVAKKVSVAAKAADKAATSAKSATKTAAKKTKSVAKSTAKATATAAKKASSKTKSTAKKVAEKAKSTAKKVSDKAVEVKATPRSSGSQRVPSKKSDDGRKGSTLRVPRSVKDMPWFRKK